MLALSRAPPLGPPERVVGQLAGQFEPARFLATVVAELSTMQSAASPLVIIVVCPVISLAKAFHEKIDKRLHLGRYEPLIGMHGIKRCPIRDRRISTTFNNSSPRAKRAIFSAITVQRRSIRPSVHAAACGVMMTLSSSWNGSGEGRTSGPPGSGQRVQTFRAFSDLTEPVDQGPLYRG